MDQFFTDEESPCGAVKTGHATHIDGILVKTWECGCQTKEYLHGIKTDWCGWMAGSIYRMLPGVFESFATQDGTRVSGNRNGKKLYQR